MIIDILLIVFLITHPTIGIAATVGCLIALRHVPWFADAIADMAALDSAHGLTVIVCRFLLPAWTPHAVVMSRTIDLSQQKVRAPVHGTIPGIAGISAIPPVDRDITLDAWLIALTEAKDEKGKDIFTATKIAALIGGNHNVTMARIREVRTGDVAQFRQDDETTAPATYPVTKAPG